MNLEEKINQLSGVKAFVFGVSLGLLYFLFLFDDGESIRGEISNTSSQIATVEQEIQDLENVQKNAEAAKAKVERLGEKFNLILDYLPKKINEAQVLRVVSDVATDIGVEISGVKAERFIGGSEDLLEALPVNVKITGKFGDIMRFLSKLTQVKIFIKVDNLKISKASKKDKSGNVLLSLDSKLLAYRFTEKELTKNQSLQADEG